MPRLTFPIATKDLRVDVLVGISAKDAATLASAAFPIPLPIWCKGLIDTGTSKTAVNPNILRRLGYANGLGQATTQTVAGPALVNFFQVGLRITDNSNPQQPALIMPDFIVIDNPVGLSDIDVLVGLDILLQCQLFLDGPARIYYLDF